MIAKLSTFQAALSNAGIDAWALYDFRGQNNLAWTMLNIPPDAHCSRRWMVVIPATGKPVKLVHRMEQVPLEHLKFNEVLYDTKESWAAGLQQVLSGFTSVAMEYSPMNAIPTASKVDAGTIEHIRSLGHTVVSSADISQQFTSVFTDEQLASVAITAGQLRDIMFDAFTFIRESVHSGTKINEYMVQQQLVRAFQQSGLVTDSPPIVAIGLNAASPHYTPSRLYSSEIGAETVVLIDAWCKNQAPGSLYADLTWVGYTGVSVPADVSSSFGTIVQARNAALALVNERFLSGTPVYGYEVDDQCRAVVQEAGLGSAFIHRTGHNIGEEVHGPGANLDNYETNDNRQILQGTTFSIEPGVYMPDILGLRTEIGVVVLNDGTVTVPSSPMQTHILPLLADEWKQ